MQGVMSNQEKTKKKKEEKATDSAFGAFRAQLFFASTLGSIHLPHEGQPNRGKIYNSA